MFDALAGLFHDRQHHPPAVLDVGGGRQSRTAERLQALGFKVASVSLRQAQHPHLAPPGGPPECCMQASARHLVHKGLLAVAWTDRDISSPFAAELEEVIERFSPSYMPTIDGQHDPDDWVPRLHMGGHFRLLQYLVFPQCQMVPSAHALADIICAEHSLRLHSAPRRAFNQAVKKLVLKHHEREVGEPLPFDMGLMTKLYILKRSSRSPEAGYHEPIRLGGEHVCILCGSRVAGELVTMAEYEINLDNLLNMKRIFEEADEDGSGELDPSEFYEKLGPFLGNEMTEAQISHLFMKIDADCGGTIDWEEFINFFFLKRAATGGLDAAQQARLQPHDTWRKDWRGSQHKGRVDAITVCEPLQRYVTCGRDGLLRLWSAKDLAPVQSVRNGDAWVTGCTWVEGPVWSKLAVGAMDRTISFYDAARGSLELCSRVSCPGQLGPPLCLAQLGPASLQALGGRQAPLAWGDTQGGVYMLSSEPPPPRCERPLAQGRDFRTLHFEHSDWVTQLLHLPDVGLLSSSLDASLKILDLQRGMVAATVGLHKKGVRSFAYSRAFSVVASGGVERSVLLWQPKGNVNALVGELAGHSAGVVRVEAADDADEVLTLTEDGIVRLWDLRNHKCIQALRKQDWPRPEDCRPTTMLYDVPRRRLVTAVHKPATWGLAAPPAEATHDRELCAALYCATFRVVVSGDEGGTICMWDALTGAREGGFALAGGGGGAPKLTAMAFDTSQRRLLTATDTGEVKCWNFNSGAVLREYVHGEGRKEVTAVCFVARAADQRQEPSVPASARSVASSAAPTAREPAEPGSGRWAEKEPGTPAGAAAGDGSDGEGEDEAASGLVLATGWSRALSVWQDAGGERVLACQRLGSHAADVLSMACLGADVVATGDFEGEVRVWHLPSSACLARLSHGGAQFERAIRKLCWLPGTCSSAGLPLLLGCGEVQGIHVWEVDVGAAAGGQAATSDGGSASRLLCTLPGAHLQHDCITAVTTCLDGEGRQLVLLGDSGGHVRVLDASAVEAGSGPAAAAASFRQVAHWRAGLQGIASLDAMPGLAAPGGQALLLVGSRADARVSVWTAQGTRVGVFGEGAWRLEDTSTWRGPEGCAAEPPAPAAGEGMQTPREIISTTPRRTSWEPAALQAATAAALGMGAARSSLSRGTSCGASLPATARRNGSLPGTARRGSRSGPAAEAEALAAMAVLGLGKLDEGGEPGGTITQARGLAPPSASPDVAKCLGAESAGRQLADLARQARAARQAWTIPVHVQPHAALRLERVEDLPADPWTGLQRGRRQGQSHGTPAREARAKQ
eukprot:scaffold10.g2238.t1